MAVCTSQGLQKVYRHAFCECWNAFDYIPVLPKRVSVENLGYMRNARAYITQSSKRVPMSSLNICVCFCLERNVSNTFAGVYCLLIRVCRCLDLRVSRTFAGKHFNKILNASVYFPRYPKKKTSTGLYFKKIMNAFGYNTKSLKRCRQLFQENVECVRSPPRVSKTSAGKYFKKIMNASVYTPRSPTRLAAVISRKS